MEIDRYSDPVRAILMADRGYESFNTFAHLIRKGMYFVIRMKDINSNGILSAIDNLISSLFWIAMICFPIKIAFFLMSGEMILFIHATPEHFCIFMKIRKLHTKKEL